MQKIKVAMIAPPWLQTPPKNYGGTESVIENLCRGLSEIGIEVQLFTIKGSKAVAAKHHWYYDLEQFEHIHKPLDYGGPILAHHILESLDEIRRQGDFDIIHDHTTFLGPTFLRDLPDDFPPVLHTLHGAFTRDDEVARGVPDNRPMYRSLARGERIYFNGISNAQIRQAPNELKPKIVGAVHHGIDPNGRKFYGQKDNYFVNVGRIARDKGIDIGIRLARELGETFKVAGTVAGLANPLQIDSEINNPQSRFAEMPEFTYFRDHVRPQLDAGIQYTGGVFGKTKDEIIGRAKAFLFPIQWEEPFGVAVIDALVCGTPVVAMRRGSLPEIIEHGVNGYLADNEEEFKHYMTQVHHINPINCRRSVEERFSYPAMARSYLGKYLGIINRHAPVFAEPEFSFLEMIQQQKKRH
jgi:glycosyltransferase involved in cell wall biosynthesis